MKLILNHLSVRPTAALDSWIEGQIHSLRTVLQIETATVKLVHQPADSPAYRVYVHLTIPGPDVVAEGNDHTLGAALRKVMRKLKGKIADRATRKGQRIRSQVSTPPARSGSGRIIL